MSRLAARLARLPLRLRLIAGFSVAMLVVLLGAGIFVYWRVDYALDRSLNIDLRRATQTIAPLVGANGKVRNRDAALATGLPWQVLDGKGTVLDHGGPVAATRMLDVEELSEVGSRPSLIDVGAVLPGSRTPYRLRVTRTLASPGHYLVLAIRRDNRDEALRELVAQLTLAGLGALVVTAIVGDRLAHAALRPVERYRRRAAEIADGAVNLRLDVPENRHDEVTRLGHTFNDMLATLDRALARERQFVHEASHELRTPITLLSGRIQLARRRTRTVKEHEHVLDELQVDLARLAALAEQLLQLVGSDPDPKDAVSDLVEVVNRVAPSDVSGSAGTRSAVANVSGVTAERIVNNLLENARIHGAPPVTVTVDEPHPEWVRLRIADGGPGMPADLLASATQRFSRAEEARARPGTGLGLALVEALVADAGGELRLCSQSAHTSHGRQVPIACDHGGEMTATVFLPVATGGDSRG